MANDPASETGLNAGSITLVKADLGIKRVCPSCGARFYDLQKRPIECPKCEFSFEPEALYKQRRPRTPEPAEQAPVIERDDDEEDENENEEVESEEAEDEAEIEEAPLVVASDDDEEEDAETPDTETEAEESGMSVVDEDADIDIDDEDLGDDEEEDDSLLEEEEDENDDVSGIIDADIEKDER